MISPPNTYFRRNFVLGIATGALINFGMAFLDPFTVLPLFISKLGGSAAAVGLVSALHGVGWFLPQIFSSRLAATRRRLMPTYRVMAGLRTLALGAAVWAVFAWSAGGSRLIVVFASLTLLAHLAGGFSAIPFLEITSKTIPVTYRGRFFGTRRLIGGSFGITAGVVAAVVLDTGSGPVRIGGPVTDAAHAVMGRLGFLGRAFPSDFGVLFLLGWIFITAGVLAFTFASEPPAAAAQQSARLLDHLRAGLALLTRNVDYRRFYVVRICWQFTAMAFPFYASYAFTTLHISESVVGIFLSVWIGAGVFSNYLWGGLLDKSGNRVVLLTTAVLSALPPAVVLWVDAAGANEAGSLTSLAVVMCGTFLINGIVRSGRVISNITYLLEFAPEDQRPLYVGFMNSFSFPFMLSSLFGGVLIEFFGTRTLFLTALGFAVLNIIFSARLIEPRDRQPDGTATLPASVS